MGNGMNGYWLIRPGAKPISVWLRRCLGPLALLLVAAAFSWGQFKRLPPPPNPAPSTSATPVSSQSSAPQPELPQFSIKVNLVRLLVSARDATGAVVSTLYKEDLHLAHSAVS